MKLTLTRLVALAGLCLCATQTVLAAASFTAPVPYRQGSDLPFAGPWQTFYREDFEDGALNTPGLSASGGGLVSAPGGLVDSVDADDGLIDGSGAAGRSWYNGTSTGTTFSFAAAAFGGLLPTHVGIAFTDIGNRTDTGAVGVGTAYITVYDGAGVAQGEFSFGFGDGSPLSATAEDRFVGASYAGGIGAMTVGFRDSIDWEVDHVTYALATPVPEPGTAMLWATACAAGLAWRRARRANGAAGAGCRARR